MTTAAPEILSNTSSDQLTLHNLQEAPFRPSGIPSLSRISIMITYQYKLYYDYHVVYEPYVMLFQHMAPFVILDTRS